MIYVLKHLDFSVEGTDYPGPDIILAILKYHPLGGEYRFCQTQMHKIISHYLYESNNEPHKNREEYGLNSYGIILAKLLGITVSGSKLVYISITSELLREYVNAYVAENFF